MKSLLTLSSTYRKEEEKNITRGKNVRSGDEFDTIYEVGEVLGKGTTAIVRAVRRRDNGAIFACKYIDKYSVTAQRERLKEEIRVLTSARHPNLVSLHAVFETDTDLRLIVDFVPGGELFDRILKKKFYTEREACIVLKSLLSAVAFLHQRNIVHRDIKPENILLASLDNDTDIRLSDFGLAKIFDAMDERALSPSQQKRFSNLSGMELVESYGSDTYINKSKDSVVDEYVIPSPKIGNHKQLHKDAGSSGSIYNSGSGRQRTYTTLGTDYYVAPEVLRGIGYGKQVDLWSVGVVLYILLCGFPPFNADVSCLPFFFFFGGINKWWNCKNRRVRIFQKCMEPS